MIWQKYAHPKYAENLLKIASYLERFRAYLGRAYLGRAGRQKYDSKYALNTRLISLYYCIKECHLEGADLEVDVTDYVGEGDDEGDDE